MGEKVKMCQEPPEPLITLQTTRFELPALHVATVGYIRLLEMSVPPSEARAEVIKQLQSFQRRYQEARRTLQAMQGQDAEQEFLIPVQATPCELIAFSTAAIGYIRLLKATIPPCELRAEVINHLLTFQKRYLDSVPRPVPLRD